MTQEDQDWKGLYRVGGVSFLIAGILLIIEFVSRLSLGRPRADTVEEYLEFIATQTIPFEAVSLINATLTFIILIPAVPALYLALKEFSKTRMLIGSIFFGVVIILYLATVQPLLFAELSLSNGYASATNDAQRAAYVAAAQLLSGEVNVARLLALLLISVATIIIASVMLKGIFNKGAAYLGIATGIVGIIGFVGNIPILLAGGTIIFISIPLLAIWFLALGSKLYKRG